MTSQYDKDCLIRQRYITFRKEIILLKILQI